MQSNNKTPTIFERRKQFFQEVNRRKRMSFFAESRDNIILDNLIASTNKKFLSSEVDHFQRPFARPGAKIINEEHGRKSITQLIYKELRQDSLETDRALDEYYREWQEAEFFEGRDSQEQRLLDEYLRSLEDRPGPK